MRAIRCAAACLSIAGGALAGRPPLQRDVDLCTLRAEETGRQNNLQGRVRFQLLVRPDGKVYAGYVLREHGIDDRLLERCILYGAMLWELSPSALDYSWPYPISFTPGVAEFKHVPLPDPQREVWEDGMGQGRASVFLPDLIHPPPGEPLDVEAAQATLEIDDSATAAERGLAELAVRRYPAAIAQLRAALQAQRDSTALRGLSQALVESHGDLEEARALALELIARDASSEQGHEALLRVCLAAGDDECAFREFKRANGAADLSLRWLVLRDDLLAPAQDAAARLRERARGAAAASAQRCAAGLDERGEALCTIERCLADGPVRYAEALSQQDGVAYNAASWNATAAAPGKIVVTRAIGADGAGRKHDATWLVSRRGDEVVITPKTPEARQITLAYNRCAPR